MVPHEMPFLTAAQVPPVPVQAWQAPHELTVQQKPSVHLPELHSLPEAQDVPLVLPDAH